MKRILTLFLFFSMLVTTISCASQFNKRQDVQQFIHGMVVKHHFNEAKLECIFSQVHVNKQVLKLISKPAEKKPWYVYKQLLITNKRIHDGVLFWNRNARVLSDAERIYGVPASVIVAIIGIETSYGDVKGKIKTLDALSTLAFDYPARAKFFRGELEQFLLLTRELCRDPRTLYGSYAGAMGYPQFMPSSYRKYAVDFNRNKRADILNDPVDAIGSIANYLKSKGWQANQAIATHAKISGNELGNVDVKGGATKTLQQYARYGVYPETSFPENKKAGLLMLEGKEGPEYWLVFRNFYVIKAYNSSSLYAMAIYQLSQQLEQERG